MVYVCISVIDSSLQQRRGSSGGGDDSVGAERGEGVIAMTTTGAQYALAAASTGANNSGGSSTAVGVESKQNVVVVTTTSSSSGGGSGAQTQSARGQQLITVVTNPDPSSPNNLQPIQVSNIILCYFCVMPFAGVIHENDYTHYSQESQISKLCKIQFTCQITFFPLYYFLLLLL